MTDLERGRRRIVQEERHHVELEAGGTQTLSAENILIATGAEPTTIPGVELDYDRVGNSTTAHSYPTVPEHLVVIGVGVIGLKLGSAWKRLGAKVTVLEYLPHQAEHEGVAAVERMASQPGHVNYDAVAGIIYTHPEIATTRTRRSRRSARPSRSSRTRASPTKWASSPSSRTAGPRRWGRPTAWSRSSPTQRPTASWASTCSVPTPVIWRPKARWRSSSRPAPKISREACTRTPRCRRSSRRPRSTWPDASSTSEAAPGPEAPTASVAGALDEPRCRPARWTVRQRQGLRPRRQAVMMPR